MRRSAMGLSAVLTAASLLGAAAVAAQSPGTYPASRATADVIAWLRRETPLDPAKVVDVSPSSITEVASFEPTSEPSGFLAILHAEALDTTIEKEEGILSWAIPVEIDCRGRKVRLGAMTGFPGRDIRYGPRPIRSADDDWVAPAAKAPLDNVLRALCEPNFPRPLVDVRLAAQASQAPISTAPRSSAPPTRPVSAPVPVPATATATPRSAGPPPPAPAPMLRPTIAAAVAAAPRAAAPPAPARVAGAVSSVVQVAASPSLPDARSILANVQARFPEPLKGLTTAVATVTLDGKVMHRAVISGFHTSSEANRLCATLKAGGQACFVRN